MDLVIFTGVVTESELRHERAGQYERLAAAGSLGSLVVAPPDATVVRRGSSHRHARPVDRVGDGGAHPVRSAAVGSIRTGFAAAEVRATDSSRVAVRGLAGMTRQVRLIRSPISVVGMWLTTVSAVIFLVVFLADLFGLHTNPYLGIVFFLILPGIFRVRPRADSARGVAAKTPSGSRQGAERDALAAHRPQRPGPASNRGAGLRADDGQRHHRVAGRLSRRRVHGLGPVLRPGLPRRDEARVRRATRTARIRA